MGKQQTQLDITTGKEKPQPRSMRLNKGHREDIINAIMAAWDTANPIPSKHLVKDLVASVVADFRNPKRTVRSEYKKLQRVLDRAAKINDVLDQLRENDYNCIAVHGQNTLIFRFVDDITGDVTKELTVQIPLSVAKELDVPYVSVCNSNYTDKEQTLLAWGDEVASDFGNEGYYYKTVKLPTLGENIFVFPSSCAGYQQYQENSKAKREYDKERERLKQEATDYLEQFNTTGQLREYWPEIMQYVPAHLADPEKVIKLPALTNSRLNQRLGLGK